MLSILQLLREVVDKQASDLLLTVGVPPQLRLHGYLVPVGSETLDAKGTEQLARGILNQSQFEKLQERRSLDLSKGYEGLSRFRMNIFYQRGALSLAIRRIPYDIPAYEELGLPDIVKDFAMRPHGLILVTGPAGSGKSTTLATMIHHINLHKTLHIVCLEDPIEYLHTHRKSIIEQREMGTDARNFAEALRSVFRQSPDVVMVGEMRDLETMQLALSLAETGHLILATLHTQDTTHAINRIVDMFPPAHQHQIHTQLSLVLQGVISQQLVPTPDRKRRVLAYEVLHVNNAIRNLIRENQVQQIYSVLQTSRQLGMVTMNESLACLCAEGVIEEDQAFERSPRPKELTALLQRMSETTR